MVSRPGGDASRSGPLRIATFIHDFGPGGVERVAMRLVRQWRSTGQDVLLLVGSEDGATRDGLAAGLGHASAPRLRVGRLLPRSVRLAWFVCRRLRVFRADVLFCPGNTYLATALLIRVALGRRCPPIVAKISNGLERPDKSRFRRHLHLLGLRAKLRFVDRIVGMDEAATGELRERLVAHEAKLVTIHDPALSAAQLPAVPRRSTAGGPASGGRRFLVVGRLVVQKNVGLAIRAFAAAAAPTDRLTIVGDGPEREALEGLAHAAGVAERVSFAGFRPDPGSFMAEHDVLLLPSDYEGVPAVLLEAMAAGCWLVATACSRSVVAMIAGSGLGRLVPVGDEAAFAEALGAADPRRTDVRRALETAGRYTVESSAARYVAVMSDAAARRREDGPGRR